MYDHNPLHSQELDMQLKQLSQYICTCREVDGSSNVCYCWIHDICHWSWKSNWSLVTNYKNFVCTSITLHHCFYLSHNVRVNTTAKSFIWCDRDKQPLLGIDSGFFLVQVAFIFHDSLNWSYTVRFSFFESCNILSHLSGCHHLHGLNKLIYTLVIFLMDSTAFILILMALRFLVANPNWFWNRSEDAPERRLTSIIN